MVKLPLRYTFSVTVQGQSWARPPMLGRYELITRIGHGGMAEVQLALQRGPAGFEKLVVIKLIHENLASQKDFVDMLLDEARVAALVKHPNVVDIYDLGEVDGRYFIAMEYLEGEPLLAVLRAGRDGQRLDPLSTARLVADTAEGLEAAHELRSLSGEPLELVHHDISLGNIVVLYNGRAKLVDFGVAKATQSAATRSKLQGKFSYMAPEKLHGAVGDRRSDLWSLGCVLWEALTIKRLFRGTNETETMQQVLEDKILAPSAVNGDVPRDFDPIVLRALERDPARRYPTAKAMAADLEEVLRKLGYAAKNDAIAAYMQATFQTHIAARKKLLQEVSSKGRASADVLEAAFDHNAMPGAGELSFRRRATWSGIIAPPPDFASAGASGSMPSMPAAAQMPATPGASGQMPATPGAAGHALEERTDVTPPLAGLHENAPALPEPLEPASSNIRTVPLVIGVPPEGSPGALIAGPGEEHTNVEPSGLVRARRRRISLVVAGAAVVIAAVIAIAAVSRGGPPDRSADQVALGSAEPAAPLTTSPATTPAAMPVEPAPRGEAPGSAAPPVATTPDGPTATEGAASPPAAATSTAPDIASPPAAPPPSPPPAEAQTPAPPPRRPPRAAPRPPPKPPAAPPDKPQPDEFFRSGIQAWARGDTKSALAAYRRVLDISPSYAAAWRGLGLVYEKLGDKPAARAAFAKYLQLAPGANDAAAIRARLDTP